MTEEKIVISTGKEVIVKEIKYKDFASNLAEGKENSTKFLFKMATNLLDEEYDELSMKDGYAIQKAINKLNGLDESFL